LLRQQVLIEGAFIAAGSGWIEALGRGRRWWWSRSGYNRCRDSRRMSKWFFIRIPTIAFISPLMEYHLRWCREWPGEQWLTH